MKVVVVLAAVFVYTHAVIDKDEVEKHFQACIQEENVDREEIMAVFKKNDVVPEDNFKFEDLLSCYCTRVGIVNEDGTMNIAVLQNILPQMLRQYPNMKDPDSTAENVLEHCKAIESKSPGLTCLKYHNCLMERIKDKI